MNRRGFLSSLIAVPAAAYVAPNVLATSVPFEYRMNTTGLTLSDADRAAWAARVQRMTEYVNFIAKSPAVDQIALRQMLMK